MEKESESFNLCYSPKAKKEIQQIYERYAAAMKSEKEDAYMKNPSFRRIKELDALVKKRAITITAFMIAIALGIFGVGLSIVLQTSGVYYALGIVIGVIGLTVILFSKKIYNGVLLRQMKKYAPEIVELSSEYLQRFE